jgi:hypothetical protein
VSWCHWRWWRLAYAPVQEKEARIIANGYEWRHIGHGFYWAVRRAD